MGYLTKETIVCLSVLALLAFAAAPPSASSAPPSQSTVGWLDQSSSFRRSITLVNANNFSVSNHPFLISIDFPYAHLLDPLSELKLFNGTGGEVNSYIVDERSSGGFITSVLLLTLVTMAPSSVQTFTVYYGNPSSSVPAYRIFQGGSSFSNPPLSITTVQSQTTSPSYEFTYGNTYKQAVLAKIRYDSSSLNDFGPLEIANQPIRIVSPWHAIADSSAERLSIISQRFSAGHLSVAELILLDNATALQYDIFTNTGSSILGDLTATSVVDSTQLAPIGNVSTIFDRNGGLLYSRVSGAYFGFGANQQPGRYDVASASSIIAGTRSGNLSMNTQSSGVTAGVLSWDLGNLRAGSSTTLERYWAVGHSYSDLTRLMGRLHPLTGATLGKEDNHETLNPSASVLWNATIPLKDVLIPANGLTLPLTLRGGSFLPRIADLGGEIKYFLPSSDFSPTSSSQWTSRAQPVGDASADASSSFFSVTLASEIGRLSVMTRNSSGSGVAELVSGTYPVLGQFSAHLILRYRAELSGQGNFSSQSLYGAVDVDHSFSGTFDQTVLLPALGTNSHPTNTQCGAGVQVTRIPPQPIGHLEVPQSLVADGAWRNLDLDLSKFSGSNNFEFRLRFCASLDKPFVGRMELDLATAGIQYSAPTGGIISTSLDSSASSLSLGYITQSTPQAILNGSVSLTFVQSVTLNDAGGINFVGSTPPAEELSVNSSGEIHQNFPIQTSLRGLIINTQFAHLNPALYINQVGIASPHVSDGSIFVDGGQVPKGVMTKVSSPNSISLIFGGYHFEVRVADSDGAPVRQARVVVSGQDGQLINSSVTDSLGSDSVKLMPWPYTVVVNFQGSTVAVADVNFTSDMLLNLNASVVRTVIKVTDAIGRPFAGATLTITKSGSTIHGTTDRSGLFVFQAVANGFYLVRVSEAGSSYLDQAIRTTYNGATINLKTSYLSPALRLAIVGGIAGSILATALILIILKRIPRTKQA